MTQQSKPTHKECWKNCLKHLHDALNCIMGLGPELTPFASGPWIMEKVIYNTLIMGETLYSATFLECGDSSTPTREERVNLLVERSKEGLTLRERQELMNLLSGKDSNATDAPY